MGPGEERNHLDATETIRFCALPRGDAGMIPSTARARELIQDFFTRGSPARRDVPTDHESLARLFDEVEAAVVTVADLPAESLEDLKRKRLLQELLREHRDYLSELQTLIGQSVDRDIRRLIETGGGAAAPSEQDRWPWRVLPILRSRGDGAREDRSQRSA